MKNQKADRWEEDMNLYLTSAGDRRRVIHFIKSNFLSKQEVREAIEQALQIHPEFCEKTGKQFKKCCACILEDLRKRLKL